MQETYNFIIEFAHVHFLLVVKIFVQIPDGFCLAFCALDYNVTSYQSVFTFVFTSPVAHLVRPLLNCLPNLRVTWEISCPQVRTKTPFAFPCNVIEIHVSPRMGYGAVGRTLLQYWRVS